MSNDVGLPADHATFPKMNQCERHRVLVGDRIPSQKGDHLQCMWHGIPVADRDSVIDKVPVDNWIRLGNRILVDDKVPLAETDKRNCYTSS